jgi:hypothetical protein
MKIKHMKNVYFLLMAGLFIASCGPTTVIQSDSYQSAPVGDVSYQSFYDQLSPYGNWVNYPGYGYVWMPNAGPDFKPYSTNGNWIYTDAGWTWASNYSWGWAPFHYGRWFYENGYGWMWVPGNEWAPAWVSWRGSGDYYGWAPLGPQVSVDIALNSYNPPVNYWNFVPRQYIGNPGWHNYYVNESRNVTIINNTTIINNYSGTNRSQYAYAPGPDPVEVRRVSGNNFATVQLRQANAPGERVSGSQYMIYHPRVSANTPAARGDAPGRPSTPAPARSESFNNVRPSTQYPANSQPNSRPGEQNPGYNQPNNNPHPPANNPQPPVNNPRPAAQNPGYNPPANNGQPAVNNPRPAAQNPGYNPPANNTQPPANNPRPAAQNPGYNPPANNGQPAVNNPRPTAHNPGNNPPVNNGQPAANNPRPTNQNPNTNASSGRQNDSRVNQNNQHQPGTHPAQPRSVTQPLPVNHTPVAGHPSPNQNPNAAHPVQRTPTQDSKPAQKPTEKPKPREADNN